MKKSLLALAVIAMCAFSFTSCDTLTDLDLVGHINLTATNPTGGTQYYTDSSTTLNFSSAMCNVNIDSAYIDAGEYAGTYDVHAGTVMVGTMQTLISNDIANITYPLCAINLRDTNVGNYPIECPVNNIAFFEYLIDTADVNSLITSSLSAMEGLGNLFVVAVAEDAFYIGYTGNVNVTAYGRNELQRVEGSVSNVEAIYATVPQIEALVNMPAADRPADLISYFPHITFNGTFSSMRADIESVINALNESGN